MTGSAPLAPLAATLASSEASERFGRELARELRAGDVLVLTGPLGAGKTTLARGLGEGLGVRGPVASPTFVVARTHPSLVGGPALIHVDAYRLRDALELDDLDLDLPASVTVIEWGAPHVAAIADSWLELELERPRGAERDPAGEEPADGDASGPSDASDPSDAPRRLALRPAGPAWEDPARLGSLARLVAAFA